MRGRKRADHLGGGVEVRGQKVGGEEDEKK